MSNRKQEGFFGLLKKGDLVLIGARPGYVGYGEGGVLTTNNIEQARERCGGKLGNKGDEAAATALQMVALHNQLRDNYLSNYEESAI